jgi:hypothetical protein
MAHSRKSKPKSRASNLSPCSTQSLPLLPWRVHHDPLDSNLPKHYFFSPFKLIPNFLLNINIPICNSDCAHHPSRFWVARTTRNTISRATRSRRNYAIWLRQPLARRQNANSLKARLRNAQATPCPMRRDPPSLRTVRKTPARLPLSTTQTQATTTSPRA